MVLSSTVSEIRRLIGLSYLAPSLPMFPLEFRGEVNREETRVMGLLSGGSCMNFNRFYRAMHFSAKRGIAIACRLSVRLSVCL